MANTSVLDKEADTDGHHDVEVAPELAEFGLEDKADGPGAATVLAAGIGMLTLGLMTTLSVPWVGLSNFLKKFEMGMGVGPLAGKTIVAMIVWLVAWGILATVWKAKNVNIKKAFYLGLSLGMVGAILTFPPFFELFEAH